MSFNVAGVGALSVGYDRASGVYDLNDGHGPLVWGRRSEVIRALLVVLTLDPRTMGDHAPVAFLLRAVDAALGTTFAVDARRRES